MPSIDCNSKGCTEHNRYDSSKSSSYEDFYIQDSIPMFSITYGTGNINGDLIRDTVRVGSIEINR